MTIDLLDELDELQSLEGAWYANVGRKTGERCCQAMRDAKTEIETLRKRVEELEAPMKELLTMGVSVQQINMSNIYKKPPEPVRLDV